MLAARGNRKRFGEEARQPLGYFPLRNDGGVGTVGATKVAEAKPAVVNYVRGKPVVYGSTGGGGSRRTIGSINDVKRV